jgi:hypothetical protein
MHPCRLSGESTHFLRLSLSFDDCVASTLPMAGGEAGRSCLTIDRLRFGAISNNNVDEAGEIGEGVLAGVVKRIIREVDDFVSEPSRWLRRDRSDALPMLLRRVTRLMQFDMQVVTDSELADMTCQISPMTIETVLRIITIYNKEVPMILMSSSE